MSAAYGGSIQTEKLGHAEHHQQHLSGNSAGQETAVAHQQLGHADINSSTLSGNSADYGGGIVNWGRLSIADSILSGNSASEAGGGILNTGTLTMTSTPVVPAL
jgi:hypothetical protein